MARKKDSRQRCEQKLRTKASLGTRNVRVSARAACWHNRANVTMKSMQCAYIKFGETAGVLGNFWRRPMIKVWTVDTNVQQGQRAHWLFSKTPAPKSLKRSASKKGRNATLCCKWRHHYVAIGSPLHLWKHSNHLVFLGCVYLHNNCKKGATWRKTNRRYKTGAWIARAPQRNQMPEMIDLIPWMWDTQL